MCAHRLANSAGGGGYGPAHPSIFAAIMILSSAKGKPCDLKMEAVIFTGIQASGKTTFYLERFFETHVRLSLDMLRTRNRERILLEACLVARQPFVIDNTNVTAAARAVYIEAAKRAGFRVVGYFFRTEAGAAIRRNSARPKKRAVPVGGILATLKRLEPPAPEEGFDELFTVEIGDAGGFVVT